VRRRFQSQTAPLRGPASLALAIVAIAVGSVAAADGAVYEDGCLPPPASQLRASAPLRFETSSGTVVLDHFVLSSFATPCERLPKAGSTDTKTYDALLLGDLSVGGGAPDAATTTAKLTQAVTGRSKGGKTRVFDLELLGLDPVSLGQGVRLRESPTRTSLGQAVVGKAPRGAADVDGFVDVWTEVSVDGGFTWVPAVDGVGDPATTRLVLEPEQ
jgi:hypothetical protein